MTVYAEKASLQGLHLDQLSLSDSTCTLSSNSTHVFGTTGLNECGTLLEVSGENLKLKHWKYTVKFSTLTMIKIQYIDHDQTTSSLLSQMS